MYYGRGARGLEVIPNLKFWFSIPGLIKVSITEHQFVFPTEDNYYLQDGCMCIVHPKTIRPAYDRV